MDKPPMQPLLARGAEPHFVVKVERRARPPAPWAWAIHEEGRAEPSRCSTRHYRSAEDAWAVGKAVLERLPKSAMKASAPAPAVGGMDPGRDSASD